MNTLIKKEDIKNEGLETLGKINNRDKVLDLLKIAPRIAPDIYELYDEVGQGVLIDVEKGTISRIKDIDEEGGYTIKPLYGAIDKLDGRAVFNFYLEGGGVYLCKQYLPICYLTHREEFDTLQQDGVEVVVNHKDNDPTNNRGVNLEPCTSSQNREHGQVVKMIHQVAPELIREELRISKNSSATKLQLVLKHPLSVKDIQRFKELFNIDKIQQKDIQYLLVWLSDRGWRI